MVVNGNGVSMGNTILSSITRNTFRNSNSSQIELIGGVNGLEITENFIRDGDEDGIEIRDSFGDNPSTNVDINCNNIQGNAGAGLRLESESYNGILDAEFNWWGSPSGPRIDSNPGGTGQRIVDPDDQVDFRPFLTSGEDISPSIPGFQCNDDDSGGNGNDDGNGNDGGNGNGDGNGDDGNGNGNNNGGNNNATDEQYDEADTDGLSEIEEDIAETEEDLAGEDDGVTATAGEDGASATTDGTTATAADDQYADPDTQSPVSDPLGDVVDEVNTGDPLPPTGGVLPWTGGLPVAALAAPLGVAVLGVAFAVLRFGTRRR